MKRWILLFVFLTTEYMYKYGSMPNTSTSFHLAFPPDTNTIQIQEYEEGYTIPCLRYVDRQGESHVVCDRSYMISANPQGE